MRSELLSWNARRAQLIRVGALQTGNPYRCCLGDNLGRMTPQSHFMVVAPIVEARISELRALLRSMNDRPGMAKPDNPIVPFGRFENLHFARFVILDDQTVRDFEEYGAPVPNFSVLLAFLGDCDGPGHDLLAEVARLAAPGLRQIFSFCQGFAPDADLLAWMKRHSQTPAANYVNWVGRTVKQVREEAGLRHELMKCVREHQEAWSREEPQKIRDALIGHCRRLLNDGSLLLTRPQPTPFGWSVRNFLHYAILPAALFVPWFLAIPFLLPFQPRFFWIALTFVVLGAILLFTLIRFVPVSLAVILVVGLWLVPLFILFPLLIVPAVLAAAAFLRVLRHYEKTEPEIIHRPEVDHILELAALEDHDVTNQFTALGSVKPSRYRRALFTVILWLIDYFARHVFGRGHLGRIRTIHFARWVFLEGKERMVFASNYDGSHEAYMDDFINKAGWGLNFAFTCGLGYPRTRWIIKGGATEELKFKYTQRRHQKPTETWYRAYPGLTVYDLERNSRVRAGFERHTMTDSEVRAWLRDL
jgi:hypothetical protein